MPEIDRGSGFGFRGSGGRADSRCLQLKYRKKEIQHGARYGGFLRDGRFDDRE